MDSNRWTRRGFFREILSVDDELLVFSNFDLFVSKDNGFSWSRRSTLPLEFGNVFIDSSNLFLLGDWGVYVSSDKGQTWSGKNNGLFPQTMAISMTSLDSFLFLGGQVQDNYSDAYGILYKSTDYGESWKYISVPFVQFDMAIRSLISIDSILVASGQHAIYRSTDFGASWEVVVDTTGAFLILHKGILLAATRAGLLRSSDFGKSWFLLPFYCENDVNIGAIYQDDSKLFFADPLYEIFMSSDGGIHWEHISEGPHLHNRNFLGVLMIKDSLFLVGDITYGLFRSTDQGNTWEEANNGLVCTSIVDLYTEDNLILASTYFPSSTWGYLFRSTDNGSTWGLTNPMSEYHKICFLRNKDVLIAGMYRGIEVSTDNGITWNATDAPEEVFNSLVSINDSIYAGSSPTDFGGGGLYLSTNQGTNWQPVLQGLPSPITVATLIVVSDPNTGGKLIFLGSNRGIYRSSDGGNHWIACKYGIESYNFGKLTAISASTGSKVNLITGGCDLFFLSTDLGESWVPISSDNNFSCNYVTLISFPEISGLESILFAIGDPGIFMSSDQGKNWIPMGDDMKEKYIFNIDVNSEYLYAGTSHGVWKIPLSEITSVLAGKSSPPESYCIEQNYPNPFNSETVIKYSIPHRSLVSLEIYDLLGREIATLINQEKRIGNYEVKWNAANQPSGIYFYRVVSGNYSEVKKMLLIK